MAQVFRDMRRAASLARKKEGEAEEGPQPEAPPGPDGPVKRATLKQRIRSLKRLLNSNVSWGCGGCTEIEMCSCTDFRA